MRINTRTTTVEGQWQTELVLLLDAASLGSSDMNK